MKYGTERERTTRISCPWPKGNSISNIDIPPFNLLLNGLKDTLNGQLLTREQEFVRTLTLRFHLKEKQKRNHVHSGLPESPYLAIYDMESDESAIIARKLPYKQILVFSHKPGRRQIKIKWTFNCLLTPENPITLDKVYIRTGPKKELLNRLTSDISKKDPLNFEKSERVVWSLPYEFNRGIRFKTVESNLAIMEQEKLFYDQVRLDGLHPVEGDLLNVHKDFRGKMGFLTRRIEHSGMVPCLAFSPLNTSRDSEIYRQHPEWLAESLKGDPLPFLDITNPEVRSYLEDVMETFRNQWGFKGFHLKGLSCLDQAHFRKNNSIETGLLLTKTLHFFKEIIGKNETLSCEGIPCLPGFGFVTSLTTVPGNAAELKYTEFFNQVLGRGLQNAAFQRRLWLNEPGFYPLGSQAKNLPVQIRESIRQLILITGGILPLRIDHSSLDTEELENIRHTMDAFRPFCKGDLIPLSYTGKKTPALIFNTIGRLGVFNLSRKRQTISLDLSDIQKQIGMVRSATFIKEGKTGMKTGTLDLILPPYGSRIFHF